MNTPIISNITVVAHEETREVVPEYEVDANGHRTGRIAKLTPTNERSFITLQLPTGAVIRAEIAQEDFDRHFIPVIERQFPEWSVPAKFLLDPHPDPFWGPLQEW